MQMKNYNEIEQKITKLHRRYLDFWDYCREKKNFINNNNIREISEDFGCGISFVYNFLEKIGIKKFRDFRIFLDIRTNNYISNENDDLVKAMEELLKLNILFFNNQNNEINNLLSLVFESKNNIFFCGLGYSFLAAYDLYSFKYLLKISNWFNLIEGGNGYVFDKLQYKLENAIFVFFSLSGRSKRNINFIKELKVINPTIKIVLITGSTNFNKENIDISIITNNSMKVNDVYKKELIISPVYDFLLFNNMFKTNAFRKNKELFLNSENFNKEFTWWANPKKTKNIKF